MTKPKPASIPSVLLQGYYDGKSALVSEQKAREFASSKVKLPRTQFKAVAGRLLTGLSALQNMTGSKFAFKRTGKGFISTNIPTQGPPGNTEPSTLGIRVYADGSASATGDYNVAGVQDACASPPGDNYASILRFVGRQAALKKVTP
jgi:hypothetical protein